MYIITFSPLFLSQKKPTFRRAKIYADYKSFVFLNSIIRNTTTATQRPMINGYPFSSPGIFTKFIPNHPVIRLSGMKIADTTVKALPCWSSVFYQFQTGKHLVRAVRS